MDENDKAGFLAAQIEQAQRRIEMWPQWLKDVTRVTSVEAKGEKTSEGSDSKGQPPPSEE